MKTFRRMRWSGIALEKLRRLAWRGLSVKEISEQLRTTEEDVCAKARSEGIRIGKRIRRRPASLPQSY
jgi:hypothetical protein